MYTNEGNNFRIYCEDYLEIGQFKTSEQNQYLQTYLNDLIDEVKANFTWRIWNGHYSLKKNQKSSKKKNLTLHSDVRIKELKQVRVIWVNFKTYFLPCLVTLVWKSMKWNDCAFLLQTANTPRGKIAYVIAWGAI